MDSKSKNDDPKPITHKPTMANNFISILIDVVALYISVLLKRSPMPPPEEAQLELFQLIQQMVICENKNRPKNNQIKMPEALPPYAIAQLSLVMFHIRRIPLAGMDNDPARDELGIYQQSGPDKGIYVTSDHHLRSLMSKFNPLYTASDYKQFKECLKQYAERQEPCRDRDLVAVNNGIFNYATKQLQPFIPDHVFLSKSRVDYVASPANPVIHNPDDGTDWDVETWMAELSDDPEVVQLLWEILGAIIRPNVPWNKSSFFFSETGNNGKGTLCALMRNLAGKNTCASISLADFSKEFMLEGLVSASCIVVDENDVGTYIDKGANLKAVITGDVLQINRKYEKALTIQFRGFMVQCLNEMPRIKDKSESLYRRFLFVPFNKCFTGAERKYIKEDYLARPEVLQYVLWRVLNMNYYELSSPKACQDVLNGYKSFNDPLRQFVEEFFGGADSELQWDVVPLAFIYDLYKAWFNENCPGGLKLGRNIFFSRIAQMEREAPGWRVVRGDHRPGQGMAKPEPLITRYKLENWRNKSYQGTNPDTINTPIPKDKYRGCFVRVAVKSNVVPLNTGSVANTESA